MVLIVQLIFLIFFLLKKINYQKTTINHELIHTTQMKELGYIFFYLWYVIEYCLIRLFHKKQVDAYHDVSFEEEAYNNQYDLTYLDKRKHYSWIKYIKLKSNGNL